MNDVEKNVVSVMQKKFYRRIEKRADWKKDEIKAAFGGVLLDLLLNGGTKKLLEPKRRVRTKKRGQVGRFIPKQKGGVDHAGDN